MNIHVFIAPTSHVIVGAITKKFTQPYNQISKEYFICKANSKKDPDSFFLSTSPRDTSLVAGDGGRDVAGEVRQHARDRLHERQWH